jgi:branched-subunit amino acid aminotransferase/4-amino-4-deoxychorismate lyase
VYSHIDGRITKRALVEPTEDIIFGCGFFETLRVYNYTPFMLNRHLRRLRGSTAKMGIKMNTRSLEKAAIEIPRLNRFADSILRIIVTRRHQIVMAQPLYGIPVSASLSIVPWQRKMGRLSGLKTLNYFENILARELARKNGAFEAIFCDEKGRVLEGSVTNVFIVRKNVIYTPPLRLGILNGITRQLVFSIARKEGIRIDERPFIRSEMLKADEVFLSNSVVEVLPVHKVGSREIKLGPLSARILERYRRLPKA